MLHTHFVLETCNDVTAEFIQSENYVVFKKRETDDETVLALVQRKKDGPPPFRPFRFSNIRVILKCNDRITCSCCAPIVHGRPCRHLLAYNVGSIGPSDLAHVHTKAYASKLVTSDCSYDGVVNRRPISDLRDLPELVEDVDAEQSAIVDGDEAGWEDASGNFDDENPAVQREKKCHGFRQLQQEVKRFTDKWGNIPRALKSMRQLIIQHDIELGEVASYRSGRGSSRPTPQSSRANVRRRR
jgi:hypothetical protein